MSALPLSLQADPLRWQALQPAADARGATLFESVTPERSNIHFENRYDHPERWLKLWHQYFLGTIGTGVALGDVNGDGQPDIYAVGKDSPNALYINKGGWNFEDVTESAGVAGGSGIGAGVTFVDIDNDGDLDIYATYTGSRNELYINDGKGSFREAAAEWRLDINTGSNAPSFADYDRDGDLDLYLQCNFLTESGLAEGMPDFLFENRGNRFADVTEEAGIEGRGQGHAAIWWDYNEDGWPDIYIANDFEPADKLYRNNKDGTFTNVIDETLVSSPYSAMGADLGDINNDGHVDFLVSEMSARDHGKAQRTVLSIGTKLLRAPTDTVSQFMKNMLSVKIGPSQFAEVAYLAGLDATDWTWAARLADLDNDGLQDAFFTNGMARAFHDGDIGLKSAKAKTGWQRMAYFKQSPQYDEQNLAYRNRGDFRFEDMSAAWGLDMVGVSFAAAFADFDGDGDLDIVLSNMEGNLTLYRNTSSEGARVTIRLEGVESNRYGVGAKVRAQVGGQTLVRELSLTRGYLSSDEPILHFGLGDAARIDRLEIEWPSGALQTFEGLEVNRNYWIREEDSGESSDLAAEPLFVLSSISVPEATVSQEEHFQMFPRQMLIPAVETSMGPELAVDDLNGDGRPDVVLGGATGQPTRVFLNKEGRALKWVESDAFEDDFDSEDRSLVLFDYEGDGAPDLFASSGSIELDEGDEFYRDRIYRNDGEGSFEAVARSAFDPPARPSGASVAIDYDGDGDLDLLVAGGTKRERYPLHEDNQVWRREGLRFVLDEQSEFARAFRQSGNTTELLVVDWTGDGVDDLAQVTQWGPPLLWRRAGGGLVRDEEALDSAALRGVWRSVTAGDFDGDGRVDLVLGNLGLNTKYRATPEEPVALFAPAGEHLENTYIEAYTIDGALYPVESRELHDIQFPGLLDKLSITEYSERTVEQIFPENLLAQYRRYDMTETRSVILSQRVPGKFTAEPLPYWAQSGVVSDLLVADFDRDGVDDLALVHETLPPKLWAERPLRGHLSVLLNRGGEGGFEALLPWRSGLETSGHPRNLAWADMDGDGLEELLVSMNDGPLLIFQLSSSL